ncbi:hypothetical protein F2Q68_00046683 [Brassica cretica]|uniref:Protein kinase domain-containing protein n=1 Tax=Brassica cretica TaxID=69181 RepID=A0A8S9LLJ4_BRACR|nr:hypothetical protein F2Q68_00046683 [Brassica cretica]
MNKLKSINLGQNKLDGELSDMFQKLSKLETVDFSLNKLSGKLPQSFANLTSLKKLHLQENRFTGDINVLRNLPIDDLNIEDNQFEGWIPNELKEIDSLLTGGGNDWSTETAPPPPPGVKYGRKSGGSNQGGGMSIGTGLMIAGASLGVLVLIIVLIGLVSKKKSSPNPHFIDEDNIQHTPRLRSMRSHGSSQELRIDFGNDYKGRKSLDSDDENVQGVGSKGLKHSVSSRVIEKPRPERSLVRWATPQLHDIDALSNIADPALHGLYPPKSLSRFADIIALCVQVEPEFRPPMSEVVQALVRMVQRSSMKLKDDLRAHDEYDF